MIDDLDCIGMAVSPYKTDAQLIIDPDTVLSLSRTFECLKSIGRWYTEIFQQPCIIEHPEFPARDNLDICGLFPGNRSFPDLPGFLVLEMPDHGMNITSRVI